MFDEGVKILNASGSKEWLCASEADTQRLAKQLAQQLCLLNPSDALQIQLQGNLGAGKTTFVRYLLQALGVKGRIKSPTYALVETYDDIRNHANLPLSFWHFDFYRFKDPVEWQEAGFRDIFAGPGVKLVEWPAMAESELPIPDIAMHITVNSDNSRTVTVYAMTPIGKQVLFAFT